MNYFKKNFIDNISVLPHSINAEQSILGILMIENNVWNKVFQIIDSNDFYIKKHKIIFNIISQLAEKSKPFDIINISNFLEKNDELNNIGGYAFLKELTDMIPSIRNISSYVDIVKENSILRNLIMTSRTIANKSYYPGTKNSKELVNKAVELISSIAKKISFEKSYPVGIKKIVSNIKKDFQDKKNIKNSKISGIKTGYDAIDKMTSGFQEGDLIIIAGRPSMGKTLLSINFAENIALNSKDPVLIFSMEMSKESLVQRILSSLSRIDHSSIRNKNLNNQEWNKLFNETIPKIENMQLYIDDTPSLTPFELQFRVRQFIYEYKNINLIIIDYLQLMKISDTFQNRNYEISEISRNLKALAKEMNIPIIVVSQLSRKLEIREEKRPINSDLRESGAIEQDADVIMFIYRDEMYYENSKDKGIAEIIFGKQRNGPTGKIKLTFTGKYCRFDNYYSGNYSPSSYYI